MFRCPSCYKSVSRILSLKCKKCNNHFHFNCAGFQKLSIRLVSMVTKRGWECFICENETRRNVTAFRDTPSDSAGFEATAGKEDGLSGNLRKLRISGMRVTDWNDASVSVKRLAAIIGATYYEPEIVCARFEFPVGSSDATPSICVEFVTAEECEVWMKKYREKAKIQSKENSRVIHYNLLPADDISSKKKSYVQVFELKM